MKKKLNFKKRIIKMLQERDENFFYLAPDIVGSVATANMDMKKRTFNIEFDTTDGKKLKLIVPSKNYEEWSDKEENSNLQVMDYLLSFIGCSKEVKEGEEEMLGEIVDEYGDLMPDENEPSNKNFSYGGMKSTKFGSDKVIKQRVPKSKRYYGDLGLGVVTW